MIINGVEYLDPYKKKKSDKIYWLETKESFIGQILFSFDLKTVYNFFEDYESLTAKQKEIFNKENPTLYELKV